MVIGDNSFTNTRITPIVCIPESREKLYKDYNNREEIESKKRDIRHIMDKGDLSKDDFILSMKYGRTGKNQAKF